MRRKPHTQSKLTRRQHYFADKTAGRRIFGYYQPVTMYTVGKRGSKTLLKPAANPVHTQLKVPELRKRRSERDPEVLREQQRRYIP